MRIFFKTIKEELVTTLVFSVILTGVIYLAIQEFAIARHLDFTNLISKVPDVLKPIAHAFLVLNIFGGYLHIVVAVAWIILTGLFVCLISSGLIAREVEHKTMALLVSYPVNRVMIVAEKYLAFVFHIAVAAFFAWLGFYLGTYHGALNIDYKVSHYTQIIINGFMFFLALSAIGLFFSVIFNEHKKAAVASTIIFLLSYLVYFMSAFSEKWRGVRKFTLFNYFDTEKLFMSTSFNIVNIKSLLLIAIILFIFSVLIFRQKDITA